MFGVIHTDGSGDNDPPVETLSDLYDELISADREHGDVAVVHDASGWCMSAHLDGRIVLSNLKDPQGARHLSQVAKERVLELWKLLVAGELDRVLAEAWKSGYGDP